MAKKRHDQEWMKKVGFSSSLTVFVVLLSAPFSAQASDCGDSWSQIYYDTTGAYNIRSMSSNGSIYVAVGDCDKVGGQDPGGCIAHGGGGLILTSTDLTNWTHRYQPFTSVGIHGIAYGAGKFVAVGNFRKIGTSPDGITWTPQGSFSDGYFYEVIYADSLSLFVAVGGKVVNTVTYGTIFTSPDGINWTERPQGNVPSINCVCLGKDQSNNDLLVAVSHQAKIRTSLDGITWTLRSTPTTSVLLSVDYGNGRFVAAGISGVILTSTNGVNWTEEYLGEDRNIWEVTYAGSVFFASVEGLSVSNAPVFTSPFGANWTLHSTTGSEGRHHWGGYWDSSTAFAVGYRSIRSSDCPPIPYIVEHPEEETVCEITLAQFCVTATGVPPLYYQWQRDTGGWSDIGGAQSECYQIGSASTSDAGQYRCRVWNTHGTVTSNPGTLTVRVAPKTFSEQPATQNVCEFESVHFCVMADGSPLLSYQWERDSSGSWANAPGGNQSCLTINSVDLVIDGGDYRCQVWNECGTITSNQAKLTVNERAKADFDCDGDVDQEDFGHFQACLTGSGEAQTEIACADAKLDGDTDVDADDFAKFLTCMSTSGPGISANPTCAD